MEGLLQVSECVHGRKEWSPQEGESQDRDPNVESMYVDKLEIIESSTFKIMVVLLISFTKSLCKEFSYLGQFALIYNANEFIRNDFNHLLS